MGIYIVESDEVPNGKVLDELKEGETLKKISEKEKSRNYKYHQHKQIDGVVKSHNQELGGFIFCYYEDLLNVITDQYITRAMVLSTYINTDGRLSGGKKYKTRPLLKREIISILQLNDKTAKETLDILLSAEIMYEKDNIYYMNKNFFILGTPDKKKKYIRVYIDTTRELYRTSTARQHKTLFYIYRLIPYLHYKSNLICNDTNSTTLPTMRLSLEEIMSVVGLGHESSSFRTKFNKQLKSFKITYRDQMYFIFGEVITNKGEPFFMINPLILWKGDDLEDIRDFTIQLIFTELPKRRKRQN